jgi:HAD superfamily hydrolase (TIGR01509 family)
VVRLGIGHGRLPVRRMSAADEVASLLAHGGPLLLDFDGPVRSIFAGYPAPVVAGGLVELIQRVGGPLPAAVMNEPDPLEVLRWTGQNGTPELVTAVEDALCTAELRAVETAEPTPYGREVIVAARQIGRPVAVVSNNSAGAVTAYLTAHRLAGHVFPVVGRAYGDPARMKPNPDPIVRAARALGVEPGECTLIGDSLSDIEGGRAAGVPVIGYANKSAKVARLADAGAAAVVTTMADVANALMTLPEPRKVAD